jgi:hypothetical protein
VKFVGGELLTTKNALRHGLPFDCTEHLHSWSGKSSRVDGRLRLPRRSSLPLLSIRCYHATRSELNM